MTTQAVISLVKKGHTFIKIICGCNGGNALRLVKLISVNKIDTIQDIYNHALKIKFGCNDCLVVMNKDKTIYKGDEDLNSLYRETFDNPSFNPRWKIGSADYVFIIRIDNPEWSTESI